MHPIRHLIAGAFALATCSAAAQTESFVVEQATLSDAGARHALDAAVEEARKHEARVSIAVVDANGHLLAFGRLGNAFPATIENAIAKASTAAQLGAPSGAMQDRIDGGRFSYLALVGLTPLRGGVPIFDKGRVIGGIASSGASAQVDESIAAAGAGAAEAAN